MVTVVRPTHQTISLHVANVGSSQIQPTLQVLSSVRLPNRRIQLWVLQRARPSCNPFTHEVFFLITARVR